MAALTTISQLVRMAVPGCPEPVITDAIIAAAIEFCRETRAVTQTVDVTTVIGQAVYAPAVTAGTRAFRAEWVEREGEPLNIGSRAGFASDSELRGSGTPTAYYLDDGDLVLGPVPDAVETLEAQFAIAPAENATTLPDVLVDDWRRVIAAGAKALLLVQPKAAWQSLPDAANEAAAFRAGIDAAIVKRDAGGAGFVPRAYPSWC